MNHRTYLIPVIHILVAAIVSQPAKLHSENSLIVEFNTGSPYAFSTFEFNGEKSATIPSVSSLNIQHNLQSFSALWRASNAPVRNIYRLDFPDSSDITAICEAYASCPAVSFADINPDVNALSGPRSIVPPDDYWYTHYYDDTNHHLCNASPPEMLGWNLWHLKSASVDRAWTITAGDSNVVVAIIDSSFDITNPELWPILYRNTAEINGTNGIDEDGAGYYEDFIGYDLYENDNNVMHEPYWWQRWNCEKPNVLPCSICWNKKISEMTQAEYDTCFANPVRPWATNGFGTLRHGSQMASIISSVANNSDGHRGDVVSYNWGVKILPVKIGNLLPESVTRDPIDWNSPTKLDAAIKALQYVHAMKTVAGVNIRVLNMSMEADKGGDLIDFPEGSRQRLYSIIDSLRTAGILPVGGAGNAGRNFPVLPCRVPGVFCAAAVYPDAHRSKWVKNPDGTGGSNYGVPDTVNGVPYEGVDICGYTVIPGDSTHYGNWIVTPGFEPWEHPDWGYCQSRTDYAFTDTSQMHIDAVTPMMTSGTTAQASAMAAMLVSLYPQLNPGQIEAMIRRGADPVDLLGEYPPGSLGAGAINAYKTLTLWGEVTRDTTLAGKVYISGSLVVAEGVTMTIDAGTEVFIAPDDILADNPAAEPLGVYVIGDLHIEGTYENPVRIHSWADHDTTGNWEGIFVNGTATVSHAFIKHATYGIRGYGPMSISHCRIDSCIYGVSIESAWQDTTIARDVNATHCTRGFYLNGCYAELDSCRADSNTYGIYLDKTSANTYAYIHNNTRANHNVLHGIYCNTITDIGPDVCAAYNGQHGVYVVRNEGGVAITIDGLVSEYNANGSGLRVENTRRVELKNSVLRCNYDNVYVKYNHARLDLGDIGLGRGGNNSITDPGRYHVYNGVADETVMAQNCYFGYCDEESMPVVIKYGSVVIVPYLCNDPWSGKSVNREGQEYHDGVSGNYPNPFNPMTRIDYRVGRTGDLVQIAVYDLAGRRVAVLVNEPKARGDHWVVWEGRDYLGRIVSTGVYFYRVRIGRDYEATGKMSVIK